MINDLPSRSLGIATAVLVTAWLGLPAAIGSTPPPAPSARQGDQQMALATGDYLFRTYCVACHGSTGRGDGPLASSMRRRPANLTEIARRNQGVYPSDLVHQMIDGRKPVAGHGGADMPVWGDAFTRTTTGGDEASVRARIEALVTYLESIQVVREF